MNAQKLLLILICFLPGLLALAFFLLAVLYSAKQSNAKWGQMRSTVGLLISDAERLNWLESRMDRGDLFCLGADSANGKIYVGLLNDDYKPTRILSENKVTLREAIDAAADERKCNE